MHKTGFSIHIYYNITYTNIINISSSASNSAMWTTSRQAHLPRRALRSLS